MGSGFSRHRSVKFHPSVKSFTLQCKIGQPFGEFTMNALDDDIDTIRIDTVPGRLSAPLASDLHLEGVLA